MKRFVATCLSLPLLLTPLILAGQQAQPTTSQKPTSHREQIKSRKTATRGTAQLCQAPKVPVDVINGAQVYHTCFDPSLPAEETKALPDQLQVEVINGSAEDTQVFYGAGQDTQIEAMLNKPVVVGVQSGDTRTMGGNKNPLVTRVNSAGAGDAKVTNRISPRPKRPSYQPDVQ